MSTLALISGAAALIAGLVKYGMDAYRAKHSPPRVSVSVGSESIQVPSNYTPEQVAALVTVLKDNAEARHAAR
jgi:hypothetical protein